MAHITGKKRGHASMTVSRVSTIIIGSQSLFPPLSLFFSSISIFFPILWHSSLPLTTSLFHVIDEGGNIMETTLILYHPTL